MTSLMGMLSTQAIAALIDEIPEGGLALKLLNEHGIQHFIHSNKHRRALLALFPCERKSVIVQMALEWKIRSIFLFNLKDAEQWPVCCHNIHKLSPKYMVSNGMSDMTMAIDFDEYTCEIRADLQSHDVDEIVEGIRRICDAV